MQKNSDTDSGDTAEGEAYAEGSILTRLFGDGAKVKILSAFLSSPDRDFNVTDIARLAGVSRNTVYRNIDDLQALDIVVQTREVGGSKMFQLNKDSEAAKHLAKLEWELIDETAVE